MINSAFEQRSLILECHMVFSETLMPIELKGSLTLAMGKCLWFSVKIKNGQSSLSSP